MTDIGKIGAAERRDPAFEIALTNATTAFWSPGRTLVLIVDGREQEFDCSNDLTEANMLFRLRERGTTILDDAGPRKIVFKLALAGIGLLLLLSLMT